MSRTKAPDGLAWPLPRIAVDTREQTPWTFGFYPNADPDDRTVVHSGRVDPSSLVNTMLGGPWVSTRASLHTGDYWLTDYSGNPLDGVCVVERKERDLESSLTWGHDRLEEECGRMAMFQRRTLVMSCTLDVVFNRDRSKGRTNVQSIVGVLLALTSRNNIVYHPMPDRRRAEYMAAWTLRDAWRTWLVQDSGRLAEVRRIEALERAHGGRDGQGERGDAGDGEAEAGSASRSGRKDQSEEARGGSRSNGPGAHTPRVPSGRHDRAPEASPGRAVVYQPDFPSWSDYQRRREMAKRAR